MKKIVVISLILVALGAIGFKAYRIHNPDAFPEPVAEQTVAQPSSPVATATTSSSTEHETIMVNRPAMKSSETMGVIEVGASGFNAFAVRIDRDDNWELLSKMFGKSLAYEGFATEADVHAQLKDYIATIFDKGVNGKNIHFVISSGALKNPKTELIAKAIESKGYVVNRVTADQEGKYALKALLPKEYVNSSFTVDIGSGNTKISWYEGTALKSIESYGAKYFQNKTSDDVVAEAIKRAVQSVPQAQRGRCFIIGGVPHTLAEKSRNGDERFTFLGSPDSYSYGDDEKLRCGLNIYRALQEGSGADTFVFDWDANFTIGFLLTLN